MISRIGLVHHPLEGLDQALDSLRAGHLEALPHGIARWGRRLPQEASPPRQGRGEGVASARPLAVVDGLQQIEQRIDRHHLRAATSGVLALGQLEQPAEAGVGLHHTPSDLRELTAAIHGHLALPRASGSYHDARW